MSKISFFVVHMTISEPFQVNPIGILRVCRPCVLAPLPTGVTPFPAPNAQSPGAGSGEVAGLLGLVADLPQGQAPAVCR